MSFRRGDIVLAFYPFASGSGGSRRPVLVMQIDAYNPRIRNTIVAIGSLPGIMMAKVSQCLKVALAIP